MPLKFWDEAFLTATHLINMLPSKVINFETTVQRFLKETPDYNSLRVFGCACWPNLRPYNNHKLSFRSTRCVFLGYSSRHKGFKCLEPNTGRVYISRDVTFDEAIFPFEHLRPNAGAQLRKEILLLPTHLLTSDCGDVTCTDSNVARFTSVFWNLNEVQEDTEDPGVLFQEDLPTRSGAGSQEDSPGFTHGSRVAGANSPLTRGGGGGSASDNRASRRRWPGAAAVCLDQTSQILCALTDAA
jgi:hypothetical protein